MARTPAGSSTRAPVDRRGLPRRDRRRRHRMLDGRLSRSAVALTRADLSRTRSARPATTTRRDWHAWGDRGEAAYFTNPTDYIPQLHGDHLEWLRERSYVVLIVGEGPWEAHPTGSLPVARTWADCSPKGASRTTSTSGATTPPTTGPGGGTDQPPPATVRVRPSAPLKGLASLSSAEGRRAAKGSSAQVGLDSGALSPIATASRRTSLGSLTTSRICANWSSPRASWLHQAPAELDFDSRSGRRSLAAMKMLRSASHGGVCSLICASVSRGVSRTHSLSSGSVTVQRGAGRPASLNSWPTNAAVSAFHRSSIGGGCASHAAASCMWLCRMSWSWSRVSGQARRSSPVPSLGCAPQRVDRRSNSG